MSRHSTTTKACFGTVGTWLSAANYYTEYFYQVKTVIEALDEEDCQAVVKVKRLLEKKEPQLIVKLAVIKQSYSSIVDTITRLQKNGMALAESFGILNEATNRLNEAPDVEVKLKLAQVLSKNPDLRFLRALVNRDAEFIAMCPQFKKMTPADLAIFAFAPIVSCEVERSFSIYKSILRDNRRSFKMEHLKQHLVIASFRQT